VLGRLRCWQWAFYYPVRSDRQFVDSNRYLCHHVRVTNLFLFQFEESIPWIIMAALLVLLFVFQGSRQRKMQADYVAMLDTLRVGMRVKMASGVIARIKEIREEAPGFKTVLVETGDGKNVSYLTYTLDAVQGIVNEDALAALNAKPVETVSIEEAKTETSVNGEKVGELDAGEYVQKRNAQAKKKTKTNK
jgi:preprotein translocase subunit YajC